MRFIDLNKLKVIKSHNYDTVEIPVVFAASDISIKEMKENTYVALTDVFKPTQMEINYHILITAPVCDSDVESDDFFLTCVNVITSVFFSNFCLNEGRARERRLDVPLTLKKGTRINLSLLKKAINNKTYADKFHLTISWDNLIFDLIDQSYDGDNDNAIIGEFVHSVDELESECSDHE